MKRYNLLMSCDELNAAMADAGDGDLVILDCRSSLTDADYGRRSYEAGHIPGAMFANLDKNLSRKAAAEEGRHPLPDPDQFMAFLGSVGISESTQVVAYDDVSGAIAGRLWWMLKHWLGHRDVAVLDGGFKHWEGGKFALTQDEPAAVSCIYSAVPNRSSWISTAELVESLDQGSVIVVDARTAERYRGDDEPIDPVAGHIPGAVNLFLGGNLDKGSYQDAAALKARFADVMKQAGSAGAVVHSCGSGVSALHNMIAMEKAGFSGSRLYVGSWSEWIRDPSREIGNS